MLCATFYTSEARLRPPVGLPKTLSDRSPPFAFHRGARRRTPVVAAASVGYACLEEL